MEILEKDLSYKITGFLFKAHNELGRFCKHDQYCEALEILFKQNKIKYLREVEVPIIFGDVKIKGNRLDFFIENKIVLDVKCKKIITTEDYVQMKRYLRACEKQLGIIVNFSEKSIQPKRIINKIVKK